MLFYIHFSNKTSLIHFYIFVNSLIKQRLVGVLHINWYLNMVILFTIRELNFYSP